MSSSSATRSRPRPRPARPPRGAARPARRRSSIRRRPDGLDRSVFGLADILTPNRGELAALVADDARRIGRAGGTASGPRSRPRRSSSRTPRATASGRRSIVTLGDAGAVVVERGRDAARPAGAERRAVDAVGAGDAFNGALAAGLAAGLDLEAAARRAIAAAALSTTRPGAREGMPTRRELEASPRADVSPYGAESTSRARDLRRTAPARRDSPDSDCVNVAHRAPHRSAARKGRMTVEVARRRTRKPKAVDARVARDRRDRPDGLRLPGLRATPRPRRPALPRLRNATHPRRPGQASFDLRRHRPRAGIVVGGVLGRRHRARGAGRRRPRSPPRPRPSTPERPVVDRAAPAPTGRPAPGTGIDVHRAGADPLGPRPGGGRQRAARASSSVLASALSRRRLRHVRRLADPARDCRPTRSSASSSRRMSARGPAARR